MIIDESVPCILNKSIADSSTVGQSLEIPIGMVGSGQHSAIEMNVNLLATATPYQKTNLRVSLHLTPPDRSAPRAIQTFELPVQVSNSFRYNPNAKFLLVTNFGTSAEEVESWNSLVCDRLGMEMNIWNVSLNGHLHVDDGSGVAGHKSIFKVYKGKTIIMLGNSFQYFERGHRTAMDLIDKKDFSPAALAGTSLFLSGMNIDTSRLGNLPQYLRASSLSLPRSFRTIKELVQAILASRQDASFFDTKFVCMPKQSGDNASRCAAKADRAKKLLQQQVPNLRFVITWTSKSENSSNDVAGKIEVTPCTPYDIGKFVISSPSARRFEEVNGFCVLLSLPFKLRLEMLWNEWGNERSEKVTSTSAPIGLANIVEYEIVSELARFTTKPPWPDCIPKEDLLSHLKRLESFFNHDKNHAFSHLSLGRVVDILSNVILLVDFCSGTYPRAMTFATRRKHLWHELSQMIDVFLIRHYGHLEGDPTQILLKQRIVRQTTKMRSENLANRTRRVVQETLAKVAVGLGISVSDTMEAIDVEILGTVVINEQEMTEWERLDASQELQLEQDLAHVKQAMNDMSLSHVITINDDALEEQCQNQDSISHSSDFIE